MVRCVYQPIEQIVHQRGHKVGRWGNMHAALFAENPYAGTAKASGIVNQRFHHDTVGFQQILYAKRIQKWIKFVCINCIFYLLYFAKRSNDGFTVDDILNLPFGQAVAFDGQ